MNFSVVRISKLCNCPLNILMGFYLLEIVFYTYKLHHLSLVRLRINRKNWYCSLGKCMIFSKTSQRSAWPYNKKKKYLSKSSQCQPDLCVESAKVHVMWNVNGLWQQYQFFLAWISSAYYCFFVEDSSIFCLEPSSILYKCI